MSEKELLKLYKEISLHQQDEIEEAFKESPKEITDDVLQNTLLVAYYVMKKDHPNLNKEEEKSMLLQIIINWFSRCLDRYISMVSSESIRIYNYNPKLTNYFSELEKTMHNTTYNDRIIYFMSIYTILYIRLMAYGIKVPKH